MEFFDGIIQYVQLGSVWDVIDILIVAVFAYQLIRFVRGTSAEKLLKGVLIILVALQLSSEDVFNLRVVNYTLNAVMTTGILAVVIIFQPELRRMLEQFGSRSGKGWLAMIKRRAENPEVMHTAINQTVEAVSAMSWGKTGALIIFERNDNIEAVKNTGTIVDANANTQLIKNLFYNKAPLHDGAVIISEGRIASAGCILPLSGNSNISKDLGTRHRAALGMSENYDAIAVVVSEETGAISMAIGGLLKRHLAPETLERLLTNELITSDDQKPKTLVERIREKIK